MITLATALLVLTPLAQGPPPPPPPPTPPTNYQSASRDMPFRAPAGTGKISGKIVSDDTDHKPLRRATVTLRAEGYRTGWTYVTDETGAFTFKSLPAGRYTLTASKPTYVTMAFGALKPGRTGQSIALLGGGSLSDVVVKLPKGAVITGTIRDETGAPVQNVGIDVMRFVIKGGERTLTYSGGSGGTMRTDDRGVYRIFGLQAGEYALSIGNSPIFFSNQSLRRVSASEIDAALRSVESPAAAAPAAAPAEEPIIVSAPVYYPGTVMSSQAGAVAVAAGEERSGVDITTMYVPAVNIDGRLVGPDGKVPQTVTLTMIEVGGPGQSNRPRFGRPSLTDGTFTFGGVPPGQYVITARAAPGPTASGADQNGSLFARADITVTGQKLARIELVLDNGAVVSGQLQADPAATSAADFRTMRVGLEPIMGKNDIVLGVVSVTPDETGKFAISGVTPGRYRASVSAGVGRGWTVQSATVSGRDALDDGVEVSSADLGGLTITMTDRSAEVSGVFQDASGRPAPDHYIILFPTDPKFWFLNSRRIRTARPGNDGKYILKDLPPGDYRIAAVTDVETGEWFEPSFLQQLVAASATLTLTDGEKKSFPLKIGGG